MKPWHYYLLLGALLLAGLLFLLAPRKPKSEKPIALTQEKSASGSVSKALTPNPSPNPNSSPNPASSSRIVQEKPKEEIVREYFSQQINFYGKVEDTTGDPVVGANVEYSVYSNWLSPNQKPTSGPKSDEAGRFSILGNQGASIFVRVTHPDYYETQQSKHRYSYAQPVGPIPTVDNPAEFVLRRKGITEPLLKLKQVVRSVPKDGRAIQVGLTGENARDMTLQAWTATAQHGAANNAPFEWKIRIAVPGGGLVAYEDHYQFEAPESGYVPAIEFEMPVAGIDGKWRDRFEQTYFVKLGSGNYVRMRFQMIAGGGHFAVVESYYNPSGSRNLEYDPIKAISSNP